MRSGAELWRDGARVLLELFQEGKISSGKAAEMLGLSKAQFLDLLNQRNLPYLDADLRDLEREVAAAESASRFSSAK